MKLSSPVEGAVMDFDPYSIRTFADPSHNLAALVELADYRAFRYAKAGAANTSQGKLELAPAPKANHSNLVPVATAQGAFSVQLTPGATAGVLSEYDEGIASVNAGPGAGQDYLISHNPPFNASTLFNLTLNDPIAVALTAASRVTLVHNAFNGVVEAAAAASRRPTGVGLVSLNAGNYGWLQSKGISSTLAQGAIAVGSDIVSSASVAGAVAAVSGTYATDVVAVKVGSASIIAGVDTEYRPVVLTID